MQIAVDEKLQAVQQYEVLKLRRDSTKISSHYFKFKCEHYVVDINGLSFTTVILYHEVTSFRLSAQLNVIINSFCLFRVNKNRFCITQAKTPLALLVIFAYSILIP